MQVVFQPPDRKIRDRRRDRLRTVLDEFVPTEDRGLALDLVSLDGGSYVFELAHHFTRVIGLDADPNYVRAARVSATALRLDNVEFQQVDLSAAMKIDPADFVLAYGLLVNYAHAPVHVLRLAASASKKHILIETGVDAGGTVKDVSRLVQGLLSDAGFSTTELAGPDRSLCGSLIYGRKG